MTLGDPVGRNPPQSPRLVFWWWPTNSSRPTTSRSALAAVVRRHIRRTNWDSCRVSWPVTIDPFPTPPPVPATPRGRQKSPPSIRPVRTPPPPHHNRASRRRCGWDVRHDEGAVRWSFPLADVFRVAEYSSLRHDPYCDYDDSFRWISSSSEIPSPEKSANAI